METSSRIRSKSLPLPLPVPVTAQTSNTTPVPANATRSRLRPEASETPQHFSSELSTSPEGTQPQHGTSALPALEAKIQDLTQRLEDLNNKLNLAIPTTAPAMAETDQKAAKVEDLRMMCRLTQLRIDMCNRRGDTEGADAAKQDIGEFHGGIQQLAEQMAAAGGKSPADSQSLSAQLDALTRVSTDLYRDAARAVQAGCDEGLDPSNQASVAAGYETAQETLRTTLSDLSRKLTQATVNEGQGQSTGQRAAKVEDLRRSCTLTQRRINMCDRNGDEDGSASAKEDLRELHGGIQQLAQQMAAAAAGSHGDSQALRDDVEALTRLSAGMYRDADAAARSGCDEGADDASSIASGYTFVQETLTNTLSELSKRLSRALVDEGQSRTTPPFSPQVPQVNQPPRNDSVPPPLLPVSPGLNLQTTPPNQNGSDTPVVIHVADSNDGYPPPVDPETVTGLMMHGGLSKIDNAVGEGERDSPESNGLNSAPVHPGGERVEKPTHENAPQPNGNDPAEGEQRQRMKNHLAEAALKLGELAAGREGAPELAPDRLEIAARHVRQAFEEFGEIPAAARSADDLRRLRKMLDQLGDESSRVSRALNSRHGDEFTSAKAISITTQIDIFDLNYEFNRMKVDKTAADNLLRAVINAFDQLARHLNHFDNSAEHLKFAIDLATKAAQALRSMPSSGWLDFDLQPLQVALDRLGGVVGSMQPEHIPGLKERFDQLTIQFNISSANDAIDKAIIATQDGATDKAKDHRSRATQAVRDIIASYESSPAAATPVDAMRVEHLIGMLASLSEPDNPEIDDLGRRVNMFVEDPVQ